MNVTEYVELWTQGDTATNFFSKQIILLFGSRDVAKDNFIKFLRQNNSDLQIKNTSTSFKPTTVPVKVHTLSSNVTLCDFDSFDDSTDNVGLPLGISPNYILQKVINSTEELKIILVINYSSAEKGIDRHHFTAQIRKISSWIKNIDNYANSIGLIVTNVANNTENQTLADFDQILNHVQPYLEQLQRENSQNLPMSKLLNILLKKTKANDYERMGIFRHSNNEIPAHQTETMQKEWLKIKAMLNDIQFLPASIDDFVVYTSKVTGVPAHNLTNDIIDELDKRIAKNINVIFQKLLNEFEKDMSNDYAGALMKLQKMDSIQGTLPITDRNTKEVILSIESKLNILDIHLSQSFLEDTFKLNDYFQYLLSNDRDLRQYEWKKAIEKITKYSRSFYDWNTFLREMDSVMSSYAVQKNSEKLYNIFIDKPITELNDERLQQLMRDYDNHKLSTYYGKVANQTFSSLKILSLENVFKSNLKPGIVIESNNSTKLTSVFGEFIFLSDIIAKFSYQNFLAINAASKIFIDANFTRNYWIDGLYTVSIISPVWELPVMQNVHINLDGPRGIKSFIYSGRGKYGGGTGDHGKIGFPSKSGGNFFGVADKLIHHGRSLLVTANGGKGADGTNGGEGGRGKPGKSAVTEDCKRTEDFESFQREDLGGMIYHDYCVFGQRGGDGGQGGDGAVGTEGGIAGDITLIGFEKETNIQTSALNGQRGEDGPGGEGGQPGENGKSWKITKKIAWWSTPECNYESNTYCGERSPVSKGVKGARGRDGYIREGLTNPVKTVHPHFSSLFLTYRQFLLKDVAMEKLENKRLIFLQKLSKNPSLMELDTATSLADEFLYLDTQQRLFKDFNWLSYFEQLLYRTEHYLSTKHSQNDDEVAKMVQEAVLAKIISITDQRSQTFIIHLDKHVETASDQIKSYDWTSRGTYLRNDLWSLESHIKSLASVRDENGQSIISNNAAEIADLIRIIQTDMLDIFNKSYEQFEHEMTVLKTLITMRETFLLLRFIEERGEKILEVTLSVNKYFYSEKDIPETLIAEIKNAVLLLSETELDKWKKRFEPFLKNLIDQSTAFSGVNSQLKQQYNSLLEAKTERFYETRKSLKEFVRKIVSSATDLKSEEQNFIMKLQKMWISCESQVENCHLLEDHKNTVHALQIINKSLIFSKVQRFSDNIIGISESIFTGAIQNPRDMVRDTSNLTNSLLQLQVLFQRIRKSFKLPLPELVDHSLDALEADIKRMECFYTNVANYRDIKRFQMVFHNKQSLAPIISDLSNSISLSLLQYTYQNHIRLPFYQFDFPFAYEDAKDVEITADNYHTFKVKASTAIQAIRSKISRGPIINSVRMIKNVNLMVGTPVQYIFRWRGKENEKTIENLLKGKPVTIKSGIEPIHRQEEAVRIKNVNLELETIDKNLQKELDKDLNMFGVTLKHSGVSYYKCRDSIFTFTHGPLSIHHSFEKSHGDNRVSENMVYTTLKEADYLLSPFTTWRLTIHPGYLARSADFEVLKKYYRKINIVLKAEYIYLWDRDFDKLPFVPNSSGDYCDAKGMSKYYKNQDIIFLMNSTSDSVSELDFTNIKSSYRRKRQVDYHGKTKPVVGKENIENKELYYSSNTGFTNYLFPSQDKNPVLNIIGTNGSAGTDICTGFQYNFNDCLVLLNLIVQRITDSKQSHSYFQDCAVNYPKVRQCALEIIKKYEESLEILSKNYGGEHYCFDPVSLMEELEHDLINNGGQNVNKILLDAVSPRKKPAKQTFVQRLWNKLGNIL